MHFGPLRSMLHTLEPSRASFDEILRHLLNVTWWQEPGVIEECIGYAEAGLARWPDPYRCLEVTRQELNFLDHVFSWGTLLRGVSSSRVPEFIPTLIAALEAGELDTVRLIAFDRCALTLDQARVFGANLRALDGLAVLTTGRTRRPRRPHLEAFFPAMQSIKRLVVRGGWRPERHLELLTRCPHLHTLDAPLSRLDARWLTPANFPSLRVVHLGASTPNDALAILDDARLEEVTVVGLDSHWNAPSLLRAAEERGWRVARDLPTGRDLLWAPAPS